MSRVQQPTRKPVAAKPGKAARKPGGRAPAARKPAYLQKRMAVSAPGDRQEQEADRVADEVARAARQTEPGQQPEVAPAARQIGRVADETVATPLRRQEEEEAAQTRLYRQEEEEAAQTRLLRQEEEEPAQARLFRQKEEEAVQTRLFRQEEEEEAVQTRLFRQEEEEEAVQTRLFRQEEKEEQAQQAAARRGGQELDRDTEERIDALRGNGRALPEDVLQEMQQRFGRNFAVVNIHTDGEAAVLCEKLRARAFTVGNDIFFAPGEFAPDTEQGRNLLAHELTHVVQQNGRASRRIMRNNTPAAPVPPALTHTFNDPALGRIDTSDSKLIRIRNLRVPDFKRRYFNQYRARNTIYWRRNVAAGGEERETRQRTVWEEAVQGQADNHANRLLRRSERTQQGSQTIYYLSYNHGHSYLVGNEADLKQRMRRPTWRGDGTPCAFQVDHQVEHQLGGPDTIGNMWLLEQRINSSAGPTIDAELEQTVGGFLDEVRTRVLDPPGSVAVARRDYRIEFQNVQGGLGDYGALAALTNYYNKRDIERGRHLRNVTPMSRRQIDESGLLTGDADNIDLFPSMVGGYRYRLTRDPASGIFRQENRIRMDSGRNPVAGQNFDIQNVTYNAATHTGSLVVQVPGAAKAASMGLTPVLTDPFPILRLPGIEWGGRFDKNGLKRTIREKITSFPGLSPLHLDEVDLDAQGITLQGRITPSIPFLENSSVNFAVQGETFRIWKTFSGPEISLPGPFEITSTSLTLQGSNEGFAVSGLARFEIRNLGEGHIGAEASARFSDGAGFSVEGGFNFDTRMFDPAEIQIRYANGRLSGSGTLGIPEGKVPGVRSATIRANYDNGSFSASGDAELAVPGVERGTLTLTHSPTEGTTVGGSFTLNNQVPGIRGGRISATLYEKPDGSGYAVRAEGEAQPDIPGVNSNLQVEYDDGAFTASVTAEYARGMLSGRVEAGATNRTLDAEGNPTGAPGETIIVFGGGSVTIQIAPWLQGTAGIEFAPNGEVTVRGEIGLPDELEIFARREIDRSIFNIAVQAPIVPGIVAEIGGGLSAQAGIGPGVIDQLRIGIEYNPAREQDTHVTGDAHLNVPADAGLRLSVRAGIGLGITGASATGGLEIGGTLGITGAAEAGVHLDWMPSRGLEINANVGVHAQPSFRFDLSGYVSVRALGFSVYDERFELASFEFGSDYRFGIRLPVHYVEGQPFDISLDDVEFEVPDIDTNQLLRGLVARVT